MAWTKQCAKTYALNAMKAHRGAFDLVPSLRVAIIAQAFVVVVLGQDKAEQRTADLEALWLNMLEAAGLEGVAMKVI